MFIKPDYDNSILSVSNSILRYYGATAHHNTLPLLDSLLTKNYKNVVLLIMDGMGINVLERTLPETAFLRKHIHAEISSVFPCTTTAAKIAILSGKTPAEHGWIGWSCYFKEVDKCIDLFSNHESGTKKPASEVNQPGKYLAYDTILKQVDTATSGKIKTCSVSPFSAYFANTMESICEHLKTLCNEDGQKFIFAYHDQPDHDMHDFGVSSACIQKMMADYNSRLESLINALSNTLLLITADHGMTDIHMKRIEDYPQIEKTVKRHICVEPRCCSFYIKEEYISDFPLIFADAFGDKFILFTHDEFMESGLLGSGKRHPKVNDFVGDYMAVAVSDFALWYDDSNGEFNDFKGAHAGLTKEELTVPLIMVEK